MLLVWKVIESCGTSWVFLLGQMWTATKDITANMDKYLDLIHEGKGQSDEAEALRTKLINLLGPDDKLIIRADSALRRRARNGQ